MKALIAIVMFLFGLFVGILVNPMIQEFSAPLYTEEEYSSPRIRTMLHGFGITLPTEATEINLFQKQDGEKRQIWMKFGCPPEAKDEFIENLNSSHSGLFNREVESPKMRDGTPIVWWTYSNSFRYYEFKDICVSYDEVLRNLYLYAVSDGRDGRDSDSAPPRPRPEED